ncbi:hypothetical protein AGABI2DRAFT_192172 [Agaricus bisporus var. bisporus H97]|uniref:hypothetical protein n=1 Tax=Agaricus bisporus var. bisporus (strain H97 / ATCC MYA-4626 / FGSC 10389) TaxID=936046 RepID=UPI00029F6AB4|nr:hypothetical protein AGABI2DRAFT_192172 [Agaricus bisporus var. bisporus H97]EKV48613.1 hypothetical protein AGABI2DRAFT_192172 [Agaricus bisporus var. bisporus H97]
MSRARHSGPRKLLLAFDVGTTFSGISYSILDPGKVPVIMGVTSFPGHATVANAKIPSIIFYDKDGLVRAIGAEADRDGIEMIAEEEEWEKVEWFKLHLRPNTPEFAAATEFVKPLPFKKTVVEVLSDFLKYLNDCAKQYIQERHPGIGSSILEDAEIHYILPHPNGWEGQQQALMRQAAEKAGLISRCSHGRNKLTFITEGEASLNRCIEKGLMTEDIQEGSGITIVDAGGGTLDISAYAAKSGGKDFEEIAESQCHLKGSIFVTKAAKEYLHDFLKRSKFLGDIPDMERYFDRKTKCEFRNPADPNYIRFGSVRERDTKLGITSGKLRLAGKDVASFFEPSVKCIVNSVLAQRQIALRSISNVFLVGGFAASDYLFKRVKEELEPQGLKVFRPDDQVNKVVADGAIAGIVDRSVRSRVTRLAYGTSVVVPFDPSLAEHRKRIQQLKRAYSGEMAIPDAFSVILQKNTQVSETQEFRCSYTRGGPNPLFLRTMVKQILCYRGKQSIEKYQFMDNEPESYRESCTVKADLTDIPMALCFGPQGTYLEVVIDIIILFGCTELKAQIAWNENGVEKRGPAEIIYDTDI